MTKLVCSSLISFICSVAYTSSFDVFRCYSNGNVDSYSDSRQRCPFVTETGRVHGVHCQSSFCSFTSRLIERLAFNWICIVAYSFHTIFMQINGEIAYWWIQTRALTRVYHNLRVSQSQSLRYTVRTSHFLQVRGCLDLLSPLVAVRP